MLMAHANCDARTGYFWTSLARRDSIGYSAYRSAKPKSTCDNTIMCNRNPQVPGSLASCWLHDHERLQLLSTVSSSCSSTESRCNGGVACGCWPILRDSVKSCCAALRDKVGCRGRSHDESGHTGAQQPSPQDGSSTPRGRESAGRSDAPEPGPAGKVGLMDLVSEYSQSKSFTMPQ